VIPPAGAPTNDPFEGLITLVPTTSAKGVNTRMGRLRQAMVTARRVVLTLRRRTSTEHAAGRCGESRSTALER